MSMATNPCQDCGRRYEWSDGASCDVCGVEVCGTCYQELHVSCVSSGDAPRNESSLAQPVAKGKPRG